MNYISEKDIRDIVAKIVGENTKANNTKQCGGEWMSVPVEISARHVHLTREAVDKLYGKNYTLTQKRALSQPGQFLSEERVKLVTAKGTIDNVAVLGPERKAVQVELSLTDARALGFNLPVRQSGDLSGADNVYIIGPAGMINAENSVIAAKAHVHIAPADAEKYGVKDSEIVDLRLETDREIILSDVVVRVSNNYALAAHIDYDEANAAGFKSGATGSIRKKRG